MKSAITTLLLLLPFLFMAQFENQNWHFGAGVSLSTTDTPSIGESAVDVGNGFTPASLSDSDGNLICYSGQQSVFNANNDLMPNGTFTNNGVEHMIIPFPEDTTKYYLVKSNGNSVDYSVIDLSLEGGLGDIDVDNKEVQFHNRESRLMSASKAVGPGRWLITADNNNGDDNDIFLKVWDVTENGFDLVFEQSYYYLWAGWEPQLDDAALSPDCSMIACSFKGHYIAFFRFDNATGEITENLTQSLNTTTSFINLTELEFSSTSQYLYSLGDEQVIQQWDVSSFNVATINASNQSITSIGNELKDLKLGTDGKIYVMDEGSGEIDRLENPDSPGSEIEYTNGVFSGLNNVLSTYFPNTANFACGFDPAFNVEPESVCLGEPVTLDFIYNIEPDSVWWQIGGGDIQTDFTPEYDLTLTFDEAGSYTYFNTAWLEGVAYENAGDLAVVAAPDIELGPDQTICAGETLTLNPGEAENYNWSTSENDPTIAVNSSGTYSLIASNGECSSEDEMTLTVIPALDATLEEDVYLCDDTPYIIDAGQLGFWSTGVEAESIEVTSTGTYTFNIQNECFTESDDVYVEFVEIPVPQLPEELFACLGDTLELNPQVVGGTYDWSTGESTPEIFVSESGLYQVSINYQGCIIEDETILEIIDFIPASSLIAPNVFTPNGDTKNKEFKVFSLEYPWLDPCSLNNIDVDMQIFNRWGNLILEKECSWDGTDGGGNDLTDGTYFYIIELESRCGPRSDSKEISGIVTVQR